MISDHLASRLLTAAWSTYFRDPAAEVAGLSAGAIARNLEVGYAAPPAVFIDGTTFVWLPPFNTVLPEVDLLAARDAVTVGVTATEIIEHLESPRHFLREIHALLQPGGYLLLSTPNVTNFEGRLKFLLQGELRYFDEAQYRYNHHITPITDTQMRLLLVEVGFQIIESIQSGSFSGALRRIFFPGGEVNLYLGRKSAPQTNVPIDWSR